MKALNIDVEVPAQALPRWATHWVYCTITGETFAVCIRDGAYYTIDPDIRFALPIIPEKTCNWVVLEDPSVLFFRVMLATSALVLIAAAYVMGWL